MRHNHLQSERQKLLNIARHRGKTLLKEIKEDTTRRMNWIRDEVFTDAYTDLEKSFGPQSEQTLENLHKGVNQVLTELDNEFFKKTEMKFYDGLKQGLIYKLKPQDWSKPTPEDLRFVRCIRDEVIDILAQFVEQVLGKNKPTIQAWVDFLISRPDMQPQALIDRAQGRSRAVGYAKSSGAPIFEKL